MSQVNDWNNAWDNTQQKFDGCFFSTVRLIGIVFFVVILLLFATALFSCNDNNGPVYVPPKDTTQTIPVDTIKSSFASLNDAVSKINYVFASGTPVEMKEGDNYELLQSIIDKKEGTYILPPGRFLISKTLRFDNSSVVLVGSPTTLDYYPGTDGVEITNGGPTL